MIETHANNYLHLSDSQLVQLALNNSNSEEKPRRLSKNSLDRLQTFRESAAQSLPEISDQQWETITPALNRYLSKRNQARTNLLRRLYKDKEVVAPDVDLATGKLRLENLEVSAYFSKHRQHLEALTDFQVGKRTKLWQEALSMQRVDEDYLKKVVSPSGEQVDKSLIDKTKAKSSRWSRSRWVAEAASIAAGVSLLLSGDNFFGFSSNSQDVAFALEAGTPTATATVTKEKTAAATPTKEKTATETSTAVPLKLSEAQTSTPTATATKTPTPDMTPTATVTPTVTPTPDATTTATATIEPCIATDVKGRLDFVPGSNHLLTDPITFFGDNIATNPACPDNLFVQFYGSTQQPESPGWLENQTHIATQEITIPEGATNFKIQIVQPSTQFCIEQVEVLRTSEVRIPPRFSGVEMVDYGFKFLPCVTPTATPTNTPAPSGGGEEESAPQARPTPTETPTPIPTPVLLATCKGPITPPNLVEQLRLANFPGPFDNTEAMIAAFNQAACPVVAAATPPPLSTPPPTSTPIVEITPVPTEIPTEVPVELKPTPSSLPNAGEGKNTSAQPLARMLAGLGLLMTGAGSYLRRRSYR
jgi:hypothetical protein